MTRPRKKMQRGVGLPLEGKEPFLTAAQTLLDETGCEIKLYRKECSGFAYTTSPEWWIVVPRPTTPERFGTFAHEVGHQVLHRFNSKPRWLEEIEAWEYAVEQIERFGLPELPPDHVPHRLDYSLSKAVRRCSDVEALTARVPERWRDLIETPLRHRHVEHALWAKKMDAASLRARAKAAGL